MKTSPPPAGVEVKCNHENTPAVVKRRHADFEFKLNEILSEAPERDVIKLDAAQPAEQIYASLEAALYPPVGEMAELERTKFSRSMSFSADDMAANAIQKQYRGDTQRKVPRALSQAGPWHPK